MPIKINTTNGSITITGEDGTGNANVTFPRAGYVQPGANSNITAITGLTTALSLAQGGTGATTAQGVLNNIGAVDTSLVTPRTSVTGSSSISSGTTAQRDGSPVVGYFRYNSTTNEFEGYSGASPAWGGIGGGAGYFKGDNGTTGSSAGDIFRINESALDANVTISATENASATGPLSISSSYTLTVQGTLVII